MANPGFLALLFDQIDNLSSSTTRDLLSKLCSIHGYDVALEEILGCISSSVPLKKYSHIFDLLDDAGHRDSSMNEEKVDRIHGKRSSASVKWLDATIDVRLRLRKFGRIGRGTWQKILYGRRREVFLIESTRGNRLEVVEGHTHPSNSLRDKKLLIAGMLLN